MESTDFDKLRIQMVEKQLIPRGIKDNRVLKAFGKVPRHKFVSQDLINNAYEDHPLPIGDSQTISQPYMVALMTECLGLKGDECVLEIGTGSGYQAAILAELARYVYSIERIPELAERANQTLLNLGYINVKVKAGDGTLGWNEFAPYDGIIVTAGSPGIPESLINQLKKGGRVVIPAGGSFSQTLKIVKKIKGKVQTQDVCGCVFVPLLGKQGWSSA